MAFTNKTGKAHGNIYNCQDETSVAVLQDHVTGEVFNTQPRNIRSLKESLFYMESLFRIYISQHSEVMACLLLTCKISLTLY